jgi:hypothetical protein
MTHRNRIAALMLGLAMPVIGQSANAQDDDRAAKMQENFDKKMAKPFLKNAIWETDYDKAMKTAATDGKLIFAYFTRSYSP